MSLSRPGALVASLLLATLLVTGCGDTSKPDYEKEVSEIGETVEQDLEQLESGTPSPEIIDDVQGTLEQAADDLEGIDPPNEVSGLHDDLVEVLRDTAGLFEDLSPLMEKATSDPESMGQEELERMTAVTEEFAGIQERMEKVQKGFEKKDYEIGLGNPGGEGDAKGDEATGPDAKGDEAMGAGTEG